MGVLTLVLFNGGHAILVGVDTAYRPGNGTDTAAATAYTVVGTGTVIATTVVSSSVFRRPSLS